MADAEQERTLHSERGFDGKLVHVRVDHVRLPSGREGVREVVEHPGAVAIVALTPDEQVILVRQWRHAIGEELLEIPAGTRQPGELEADTARRELIEETGYTPWELTEIATVYSSAGYCTEQVTIFLAMDCEPVERDDDPDEHTDVLLLHRNEIIHLIEPGPDQVRDAKTLIGLLWLAQN